MNSLYYDLVTGDIIDYHGGLYCMREGFMDTAVEGELALSTNPLIIRLLRFKARYGFRLSDSLEAAMRDHGLDYAWETESYQQAVMRVLLSIDNRHDDLLGSDAAVMAFAAILAYAIDYGEVDAALDAQAIKYAFSDVEREAVRRQMIALLEADLPAAA